MTSNEHILVSLFFASKNSTKHQSNKQIYTVLDIFFIYELLFLIQRILIKIWFRMIKGWYKM